MATTFKPSKYSFLSHLFWPRFLAFSFATKSIVYFWITNRSCSISIYLWSFLKHSLLDPMGKSWKYSKFLKKKLSIFSVLEISFSFRDMKFIVKSHQIVKLKENNQLGSLQNIVFNALSFLIWNIAVYWRRRIIL